MFENKVVEDKLQLDGHWTLGKAGKIFVGCGLNIDLKSILFSQ
jgi:hypothetical protein